LSLKFSTVLEKSPACFKKIPNCPSKDCLVLTSKEGYKKNDEIETNDLTVLFHNVSRPV
jgi:hypothetical protein